MKNSKLSLTKEQADELLKVLELRFKKHDARHPGMSWDNVREKLKKAPSKLKSLYEMEDTGGEPDVIGFNKTSGEYIFCDCAEESPKGRRGICYDPQALASRKKHKPNHSAIGMASEMGIELLTEEEYRLLQELGTFDTKSSSWIKTPGSTRELGGALFGDKRYQRTFIYHNGAESYYASRGFRGLLKV